MQNWRSGNFLEGEHGYGPNTKIHKQEYSDVQSVKRSRSEILPFKDEAQTALFKDPVRTAL